MLSFLGFASAGLSFCADAGGSWENTAVEPRTSAAVIKIIADILLFMMVLLVSTEEETLRVRSMYLDVAGRAVLVPCRVQIMEGWCIGATNRPYIAVAFNT